MGLNRFQWFEIIYFRVPKIPALKFKWIDIISKHQRVSSSFSVCERHFKIEDFRLNGAKKSLLPGAIPSVFDVGPTLTIEHDSIQNNTIEKRIVNRKFCKIKHCKHEVGTTEQILFFG